MDRRDPRLRVLFLIDFISSTGGAERFALGLATHLPRERFEVWMCSTRDSDPVAVSILREAGVNHLKLGRRAKWELWRFRALLAVLRAQHFDVVHSHSFGSNVWGAVLGRAFGVPVVIAHEHNWSYSGNRLRIWIDRHLIGRLATRFIAVSNANAQKMVSLEGIPSEQIVVFPTGYVPHPVTPEIEIRSELGLPPDAALIGTAAMFRVEKAIDVLIAAHARVLETFADAYLLIAGDGDCRPQLERQVDELGIGHRIRFLGTRHDIDSILRSLDVAAMSSDWEGMPLFAFECMAAGTPLVATSVGGVPEIVDDGISGLLVPPRDPAALANAIMRLLADDSLRERLGAASAARIDEYRIEAVAGSIADMYETLLADARAPLTARMLDPA